MSTKKCSNEYCIGICIYLLLLILVVGSIIIIILRDTETYHEMLQHARRCDAIASDETFMTPISNVSVKQGSKVEVVCAVGNFRQDGSERIYWDSSTGIGAEYITVDKSQPGVVIAWEQHLETYNCSLGLATVPVGTSSLYFAVVNKDHEGWYRCKSVRNQTNSGTFSKVEVFYLSVDRIFTTPVAF